MRGDWRDDAACLGTDPALWFAREGDQRRSAAEVKRIREAKAICEGCPVRRECLRFAVCGGEYFGIWGGTTEYDRRALRRRYGQDALERLVSQELASAHA